MHKSKATQALEVALNHDLVNVGDNAVYVGPPLVFDGPIAITSPKSIGQMSEVRTFTIEEMESLHEGEKDAAV